MNHVAPNKVKPTPPPLPCNPIMVAVMMEPWVVSLQVAVSMTALPSKSESWSSERTGRASVTYSNIFDIFLSSDQHLEAE